MTLKNLPAQTSLTTVQDPFGNNVALPKILPDNEGKPVCMQALSPDIASVLTDPDIILTMKDGEFLYYYFRTLARGYSLLIGVCSDKKNMIVTYLQRNPLPAQLSILYRNASQIGLS
jgi:hypothetical protein